jgi:hypothetical protein
MVAQVSFLEGLSPEMLAKVRRLAELLQEALHAGTITEAEIYSGLSNGQLEHAIRRLGPEADQLMDDIQTAWRNGTTQGESIPGESSDLLSPLITPSR